MIRRSGQPSVEAAQRLVAVARGLDLVAVGAQLVGQQDEQVRVVVDDEDPGAACATGPAWPASIGSGHPRGRSARAPSGRRTGSAARSGQASWSGSLRVADLAAVLDQVDVRLVHLVRLEQRRGTGRGPRRASPSAAAGRPGATTRSTWRSIGMSGRPKQNSSSDRRGLLADAVDLGQPVAGLERRSCRRGTRASSRRAPRGSCAASPGGAAPSGWPGRPAG